MQSNEFEGMPQMYGGRQDTYGPEQMTPLDAQRLSNAVDQVHAAILMRLNDFHSLLVTPPLKTPIKTTVGVIEIPLGGTRIEVAHLITALLSSNNTQVMDKLAELKTLSVLILPKEVVEEWETFVETSLKEINKKNNTPLMNEMPMNAMDSESYHQESSLQQKKPLSLYGIMENNPQSSFGQEGFDSFAAQGTVRMDLDNHIPESTTSEASGASGASGAALASTSTLPMIESESARSMMETTSTVSEEVTNTTDYKAATHSTVSACDSCDSSEASEDQENVVSSSTSDSLQNGPC
ncbi:unnamed protein product [Sphagnum balticum]